MFKTTTRLAFASLAFLALPAMAEEEGHDHDHPELFGAVKAFHEVLRIDWHGEPGAERNMQACSNTGEYITLARNITAQPNPDHADAQAWADAGNGLLDASVAMGAYCANAIDGNVVSGLSTVHDRFHDVMKLMKAPE